MDGKKAIRALHSCFETVYGKGDYQIEIFYQKKSCDEEGTPDWDDFENYVWDDEEGSANEEDIVIDEEGSANEEDMVFDEEDSPDQENMVID